MSIGVYNLKKIGKTGVTIMVKKWPSQLRKIEKSHEVFWSEGNEFVSTLKLLGKHYQ